MTNIGVVYNLLENIKEAIKYFEKALVLSQKSGIRLRERDLLINIAHCFRKFGKLGEAQDCYMRAKATCQEMGDNRNLCDVLIYLAEVFHEFKEPKKEIDLYEEALNLNRKLRDEEKELQCLRKLIQLHYRQHDPEDKAKRYRDDACKLLSRDLCVKPINVWLEDGLHSPPETLDINREYFLCFYIGEPNFGYSPLRQTDFIFNLVSGRKDSNNQPTEIVKTTRLFGAQEQIPQQTPETYGGEVKPIKVTETLGPKTLSHTDEPQPTSSIPSQQPRQEPSELIHEEHSKEIVEVFVRIQSSSAFKFDMIKGRLYVSREMDSETIYFGITPMKLGKQSITIEGVANDIPWDLTINNIEVQEQLVKPSNNLGMEFTLIHAGEFYMGSKEYSYEKPVHKVKINNPFYLGTYPVTQAEWKAVMGDNPAYFKGNYLPVERVSWYDVQEFIKKLNEKEGTNKYRLPSEAEWEYACRVGTTTRYSFGDSESKLGNYAWYSDNSDSKTHPVGQKKPNPWGMYDVHGNVWEWVQDGWHYNYNGAPTDGSVWVVGVGADQVFRGGSWVTITERCRSAFRYKVAQGTRSRNLGFRLLREL